MKINIKDLAISKEIKDRDGYYGYRLFYGLDYGYIMYITNLETKETKSHIIKDKILPRDLEDLEEETSLILTFRSWIIRSLTNNPETPTIIEIAIDILDKLIVSLVDMALEEDIAIKEKEFKTAFKNEYIKKSVLNVNERIEQKAIDDLLQDIKISFKNRDGINKAKQLLGDYLNKRQGIILRKNTHDIFQLDKDSNGFNQIELDDIIILLASLFNEKNLISTSDLETSISYISDRLTPEYNLVKFNNGIYSMKEHKIIIPDKPVFTLIESKYNYNPAAKGKGILINEFLRTSLKRETEEETERTILGIKQLIGYLFTSGNPRNALPIIAGVSGGGKTVLSNLITNIFGSIKTADLKLQEMGKNTHATSSLLNKHLNIIRDSDDEPITNNGIIKQLAGNEDMQVNPKGQPQFIIPKEEIPKSILVCNNIPEFKKPEKAILERFLIVEFNVKIRGTDKEDPELEEKIIANPEEIESLIYESLEAYKDMVNNNEDFILRLTEKDTLDLLIKHSKPLNYILRKLILKHDPMAMEDLYYNEDPIYTNDLNRICLLAAKDDGLEIPVNNHDKISPRKLLYNIKSEFDLLDYLDDNGRAYNTRTSKGKRIYPDLVPTPLYNKYLEDLEEED